MDWENPFSGTFDFVEIFTWMTTIMEIAVGTWDEKAACGDKWETAEGCNGIADPWAKNYQTYPDGVKASSGQYFRWLADAVEDKEAQFSIEKDDQLYLFLLEKGAEKPLNDVSGSSV
jgi:hypothetical protein